MGGSLPHRFFFLDKYVRVYSSLSFDGSLKVTHNVAKKEQLACQAKLQYIYTPKMQA